MRPRRWDPQRFLSVGGHVASLLTAASVLLWVNRGQWFMDDEWEFFNNRMHGWGRVLFEAHNEHWSTVPILVYRGLFALVGLRSYAPYVAVLVALHLLATHLLWRVLLRSGVVPIVATALAAVFAVFGAGAQNLIWAFQIGFVASVALGLGHILLVDHDAGFGRRDVAGWVVAIVGLMCSGVTVTMVLVAGLAVLFRRTVKAALATVAPPAVVYLVWLQVVGKAGLGSHERTVDSALDIPAYVWTGLSAALERGVGIPGAGAALVLLVIAWTLRRGGAGSARETAPIAMAVGAACLFIIVGAGRSAFGPEQATASRYIYIAFALLLPVLGLMLSDLAVRSVGTQLAVLAIVALIVVHNVASLRRAALLESEPELRSRRQILASAQLEESGASLVSATPEPVHAADLTVAVLSRFSRSGKLPERVAIDERDRLAAATSLQVALVEEGPPVGTGLPELAGTADVAVTAGAPPCWTITPSGGPAPRVEIRYHVPGAVSLRSTAGGELKVALRSAVDAGLIGEPRPFELPPGAVRHLLVSRAPGSAVLWLPPSGGHTEVCGVRSSG